MTWQANPVTVSPTVYYTTSRSDETLTFDVTALLAAAGAPSLPQTVLFRQDTDAAVTLADAPTIAGNVITQRIRNLVADVSYKLFVSFLTSGNRREVELNIVCIDD